MLEFDENLIPFQELFKSDYIFDLYQDCKQFNNYLPHYWNQLDLFTYRIKDMQLFLGLMKTNLNNELKTFHFEFYFITKCIIDNVYTRFELTSYPGFASSDKRVVNGKEYVIAEPPFTIISSIRVNSLKKEAIKENDYTLKSFFKDFNINNLKIYRNHLGVGIQDP